MIFDLSNTNYLYLLLGAIVAILGLGLAIYGIFNWLKRGNKVSTRLDQFVGPEVPSASTPAPAQIIPREISGSLFNRTIISWFNTFIQFLAKFTPKNIIDDSEHKLAIAGNPAKMHAGEFYAMRFLVLLAGIFIAFLMNRDFDHISLSSVVLGIMVIVICLFLPGLWLKGLIQTKRDEIRRGLPDALDMLSVCASAGLGFDQSLQKICNYWDTALGHEFKKVIQEMEIGVSRASALKKMSDRLEVDDLSRFVAILIQAETVGMSYADVLHSQALQMRIMRQYRAREIANKLPAKMILPVALLIFPALIAVILGPTIPTLIELFVK